MAWGGMDLRRRRHGWNDVEEGKFPSCQVTVRIGRGAKEGGDLAAAGRFLELVVIYFFVGRADIRYLFFEKFFFVLIPYIGGYFAGWDDEANLLELLLELDLHG